MWNLLKTQNQTIRVCRNGFVFQIDPQNPFVRFGGGGKGGEALQGGLSGSQKTYLKNVLGGASSETFEQTPIYNKKGVITGYKSGALKGAEIYPGQTYAGVSQNYLDTSNQALQNLSGNMQDVFDPIYQQASNMWNQQIMPGVMERFAGMGAAGSGGAQSALAREGQNLTTNLGATLAPMWLQNQQALPGLAQQTGTWEQANRQGSLSDAYQQWLAQQPYNNPYLNLGMSALGVQNNQTAVQQPMGFGATLGNAFASQLGQNMGGFVSDVRFKENFKIIENALGKIKRLEGQIFNFKGQDERNAGIMAQDLEKVLPESVMEIDGKKHIKVDGILALLVNALKELDEKVDKIS